MTTRTRLIGAALVAAGIATPILGATVGATEHWAHDTPSCSLFPTDVGDTVTLTNRNHLARHLQVREYATEGERFAFLYNASLPVGGSVTLPNHGRVTILWAGAHYFLEDYATVGWCAPDDDTTTTEGPPDTEPPSTTTEPPPSSTTEPPPSSTTTPPPSTTEPPPSSTTTPPPSTTVPPPSTTAPVTTAPPSSTTVATVPATVPATAPPTTVATTAALEVTGQAVERTELAFTGPEDEARRNALLTVAGAALVVAGALLTRYSGRRIGA